MNYIDSKVTYPLTTNVLYQSHGSSTTAHRVMTRPHVTNDSVLIVECISHFNNLENEKVYMYLDEVTMSRLIAQLQEAYDNHYGTGEDKE